MALILDQAAEKTAGPLPAAPSIPILAQASPGMAGVQQPYDMAVIVPELSLAGIDPHDGEERWLQQFSDAARFEVEPQQGSPTSKPTFSGAMKSSAGSPTNLRNARAALCG
jgi:hypothetical protein